MKIEARALRVADVVRLEGDGEREIARVRAGDGVIHAWYRGHEEREEPSATWANEAALEIQRPGDLFAAEDFESAPAGAVVVRYTREGGVLLGGETFANKEAIKAIELPYRMRFSRRLPGDNAWYAPRTRNTVQSRSRVERYADALRERGVPVVVEYEEPGVESTEEATKTGPAKARRDHAKRAAKLRALADKMEVAANEKIAAPRLENTMRRASIATGVRDRARYQVTLAETLRRAADVVERGELRHMGRLASKAQLEALDAVLRRAAYRRAAAENRQGEYERSSTPTVADVPFAVYRRPWTRRHELDDLLKSARGLRGIREDRQLLQTVLERASEGTELSVAEADAVRSLIQAVRGASGRELTWGTKQLVDTLREHDRLANLGIEDDATLQAALREYVECCRGRVSTQREDPQAQRRRAVRFAKIPGFFPTPPPLARRVVEAAAIGPAMRVLEPSAGSGALAKLVRERHPSATLHLVERSVTLRELLREDGFELVGDDFLTFTPKQPYDRIVMNPPFEKRQDVDHIRHALSMVAPGGRLVSIAAAGLETRADRNSRSLRDAIEELGGSITKLPAGSFQPSGTNVETVLVVVDQPTHNKPKEATMALAKSLSLAPIREAWKRHSEKTKTTRARPWKNLPKTSCFKLDDNEVSVTLCTAYQDAAIGDCPPSQAGLTSRSKQLMLCHVGEEEEYFPRSEAGLADLNAEARNRALRARASRTKPKTSSPVPAPAGDEFEAQETALDQLAPSRVVYRRDDPMRALEVAAEAPRVVLPDGGHESIQFGGEVPAGSELEPRVRVGLERVSFDAFAKQLGNDLLVYRGGVAPATLNHVTNMVSGPARRRLVKQGRGIDLVEHGRFGGRTIYWLHDYEGRKTYGPVTASGRPPSAGALRAFRETSDIGVLPLADFPKGRTIEDTVQVALIRGGKRVWVAWHVSSTTLYVKAEGEGWVKRGPVPLHSKWQEKGGFHDFAHQTAMALFVGLAEVPKTVTFRVAGPWLGVVFPSDFPKQVRFENPTGGSLDVDALEAQAAEYWNLARAHEANEPLQRWAKLAPKRVKWARRYLRQRGKAQSPTKKKAVRKAAPKPTAEAGPTRAPEEAAMSETKTNKKTTTSKKTTPKKKSAGKKPAKKKTAKKKTAKKRTAKKRPTKAETATAKKTTTKKKTTKKKTTKKTPTKKTTTKKTTTKKTTTTAKKKSAKKTPTKKKTTKKKTTKKTPTRKPSKSDKRAEAVRTHNARIRRNDTVRFRKNSTIAKGLGVDVTRSFRALRVSSKDGQTYVVLDLGLKHPRDEPMIPASHLVVLERADRLPADARGCAARLAELGGPISKATYDLMVELGRRS